ncbi:MAG: PD40 domain-containing protein [Anaerolineae bacterium]|nr:PD40 domain-containing protein [Anaerolineae bacterium]
MKSIIENTRIRNKTFFFLATIFVIGATLFAALRLRTEHAHKTSHACFVPNFRPDYQVLASNNTFWQLTSITANNAVEIAQVGEKEQLEDFKKLIDEITLPPFELTMSLADHAALLLNTNNHAIIGKLSLSNQEFLSSIEFNPSRTCAAVGSSLGKVRFLNTETGQEQRALRTDNWVTSIAFSPDGRMLAYGTQGDNDSIGKANVGIWDLEKNEELHILTGHTWSIASLAFSSDGRTLASSGTDGTIYLWDVQTGKDIEILEDTQPAIALALNHDGSVLVSGGQDHTVKLWDIFNARELKRIPTESAIIAVSFSFDDKVFIITNEHSISFWGISN